ncbi:protein kinase A catalytic subunit isoform 1, partial [Leishmania donovani]
MSSAAKDSCPAESSGHLNNEKAQLSKIPSSHPDPSKVAVASKVKAAYSFERPDTSSWKLSDFELKNTLGTGSFGRVRIAHRKGTEEYYAIKCLRKREIIKMKQQQHVAQEKGILMELCHPFIVNMMCSFQDEKKVYFVLEFVMGGEMFTHLRTAGRFPNDVAKFYQ